jgi:hypothetical protein
MQWQIEKRKELNIHMDLVCMSLITVIREGRRICINQLTNSVMPEPEVSSLHSPYPEPGDSTPHAPPPACLPQIHSNPILPFTPQCSKWCPSIRCSHQNPAHFSSHSHACHMPCPLHSPWFDLPHTIWWWIQIMKLHTVQLSPVSHYFIPLRYNYSPQHPVIKHPQNV